MKYILKRIIIGTGIALLLAGISTATKTYAWNDSYNPKQGCDGLYSFNVYYQAAIDQNLTTFEELISSGINADFSYDYSDPNSSMILIGGYDSTGLDYDYFVLWENQTSTGGNGGVAQITIENDKIRIPDNFQLTGIADPNESFWYMTTGAGGTALSQEFNYVSQQDAQCIQKVDKVDYSQNYTGPTYFSESDESWGVDCDVFDIPCQISGILDGIGDTFSSLASGIISGISWLFLPNGEDFASYITTIGEQFTDQLGILLFPFIWVQSFISQIVTTSCTALGSCTVNAGQWFGGTLIVDIQSFEDNFPQMFVLAQNFLRATTFIGVIGVIYVRYQRILRGN